MAGLRRTLGALALIAPALAALAGPVRAACTPDTVSLRWPGGGARFSVEIADTAEERARGLMHRERLARSAGMLFIYDHPQPAAFWMRNTLIPLDILFFDQQGRLTVTRADAVPGDETPLLGGDSVFMVLEINGGLAARIGIPEGAELQHPGLDPAQAAWPCD
ncbi:DUF192 domain-containing protein [Frigidibacter sp. MR17.14]|uniref:DUF192 domain-containing protein n=1 Tax=Frigidibacter sp. MR17.14 TaxID=3126509 RepID=UPI00301311EC